METLRKWSQALWVFLSNGYWGFPFTGNLYQGPLKVLCSPGLNCYSCPAATTFCPIGSLQQLLLGIRLALLNGQLYFGSYVLGCIGILGTLFGRLICGWACPFGLLQELLHKIPGKKRAIPKTLSWGKYLILVVFVVLLPLLIVDSFNLGRPWFCKYICPAGTLEAGIPMLLLVPDLRSLPGLLFGQKMLILTGFLCWSVIASRPFCRTACPLGAFYALFRRVCVIQLKFNKDNCTKCGACHSVCPVDLRFNETPYSGECIACLRCATEACQHHAIALEIGGRPFSIGRDPSNSQSPSVTS